MSSQDVLARDWGWKWLHWHAVLRMPRSIFVPFLIRPAGDRVVVSSGEAGQVMPLEHKHRTSCPVEEKMAHIPMALYRRPASPDPLKH